MEEVKDMENSTILQPEEDQKYKTFDDVLLTVGDRGRFQLILFVFYFIMEAGAASVMFSFVFDSINPGSKCSNNETYSFFNETTPSNMENIEQSYCDTNGLPCSNHSFIGNRNTLVTQYGLICNQKYTLKLLQSIGFSAVFVGAFAAQLSDFYGRKKILSILWPGLIITGICQRFSVTISMYIVMRFLTCIFCGALLSITTCFVVEFFGPLWRSISSCRIGFQFGELVLTLCAYLLMDWRDCAVAISLYTVPFFPIFLFLIPESPRWLIQKGRSDQAIIALKRIARINGKSCPSIELHELRHLNCIKNQAVKYNILHLYSTKTLAKNTFISQFCWFSIGFWAAGIASQMTNLEGSVYLTYAISKCITMALRWTVIFLANYAGRKKTFIGTWGLMICLLGVVLALDISGISSTNRLPVTYILAFADGISNFVWSSCVLISVEIFPTLLRNVGAASGNLTARIAGIIAPLMITLETIHISIPFAIYMAVGVIASTLLGIFIEETYNVPLPDEIPPAEIKCFTCLKRDERKCTEEEIEMNV